MRLNATIPGDAVRFEGDRTVQIRGLPAGAQIKKATITLTPVAAPGRALFEEVLSFTNGVGEFGMTKVQSTGAVDVDFHIRRKLAVVRGSANLGGSRLLVDLGSGVFTGINQLGGVATSDTITDFYPVPTSGILPSLLVSKFRLRSDSGTGTLTVNYVTIRTAGSNISLAFLGLPSFWVQPGEIRTAATTPNFAEFLQLYLQQATVKNGQYELPLIIHSDSLTRLDVTVDIEYVRQESALPAAVGEITLPYGHDSTAQAEEMLQVALPVGAEVTEASVQVLGSFEDSRIVFGPTGPLTPVAAVPITGTTSQAQPILLGDSATATSIDLLLSSTSQAAALDLNLLPDVNGKPFGNPLLSKPVSLELNRNLAEAPTWISVRLPSAFQFEKGTRYWLIIQASAGEAVWHVLEATEGSVGLYTSTTSGLAWRATEVKEVGGHFDGLFRLRHTPARYQVPLEVLVGEGGSTVRVSLDRYQPLGRVDFAVDFPEFAAAINQTIQQEQATQCPQGEQLLNDQFADWQRIDDVIGGAQSVLTDAARTVNIAPDGKWAYIGLFNDYDIENPARFLPLPCHTLESRFDTTPLSRQHVVIRADSRKIYVISPNQPTSLSVLDAETRQKIGDLKTTDVSLFCMTLSPKGDELYIGVNTDNNRIGIRVINTDTLEQFLTSGGDFDINETFVTWLPDTPTSMVTSPDGSRLFVVVDRGEGEGLVYGIDTSTKQILFNPIPLGNSPRDIAITPDGHWVLVAQVWSNNVSVIDAIKLVFVQTIVLTEDDVTLSPIAVEISPDGRLAFVANRGNGSVSVIDLATWTVTQTIETSSSWSEDGAAIDIAITPSGDRLYVAVTGNNYEGTTGGVIFLPLGHQRPDSWTLTTGFVRPVCYTTPFDFSAMLGPVSETERTTRPNRPSALSQIIPAVGGCLYEFGFWGISDDYDSVAEVIWRGNFCALQKVDRVPIQAVDVTTDNLGEEPPLLENRPDLLFHRARLEAPSGATQAEIRFLIPPEKNAIIDTVSFEATMNLVANSDLLHVAEGELSGWQLEPETANPIVDVRENNVRLENHASGSIALAQSFQVTAAQAFILFFRGHLASPVLPRSGVRIELHWQDSDGNATGANTMLNIVEGETEHTLNGTAPVDAVRAELHLVVLPHSTVAVEQILYQPVELITIPIRFLAQAPGKLTLRNFHIAYDVREGTTAPLPTEGLCQPTPPGRGPGSKPGGKCPWCSDCCDECAALDEENE